MTETAQSLEKQPVFILRKLFQIVCPRSRKRKLTGRDPSKMLVCRLVRFLNEHFRAFDFMLARSIGKVFKAYHRRERPFSTCPHCSIASSCFTCARRDL